MRVVWITDSKPFNEVTLLAQALKGKVDIMPLESQPLNFASKQKVMYTTHDSHPYCFAAHDIMSAIDEIDPDIVVFDSMMVMIDMRRKEIHDRILVYRASQTPNEIYQLPTYEPNALLRIHALVDHVVSVSPIMTEYIEQLGFRNVHTIPFTIPEPDPKFIVDLEEKDKAIIMGGCLRSDESILLGMGIWSMILTQEPEFELHIFNDDQTFWNHKAFRQGIKGVRASYAVTRKQSLHEVDYREIMAKSMVFFHTSKTAHTFYETLHAMSYGLPVVMDTNSLFDIQSPFQIGFNPPLWFVDAILNYLNNPDFWRKMSESGKKEVQQFYITKWVDEWVNYFKLILERLMIFKDADLMQRY